MGGVIPRSAGSARIKDAAAKTLTNARARGGEVRSVTEARLGEAVAALESNEQQLIEARSKQDAAHATLLARDEESDLEIAMIGDEVWNVMGRPAQSIDYDLIFAGGKRTWTEGDPAKQAHLMGILASNLRTTTHPKLVGRKEDWAVRIEKRAAAQAEAAAAASPLYARVTALSMQRRTLADLAQVAMTRLKRELKNMGMTEAQVHEIIPDMAPTNGATAPPAPAPEPASVQR